MSAEYARERAEAVELAHKAMATSYIGSPPPGLRGDADRMVAALLKEGWTPPSGTVVEHGVELGAETTKIYNPAAWRGFPVEKWIEREQKFGPVWRRRIIIVEDWRKVPHER